VNHCRARAVGGSLLGQGCGWIAFGPGLWVDRCRARAVGGSLQGQGCGWIAAGPGLWVFTSAPCMGRFYVLKVSALGLGVILLPTGN